MRIIANPFARRLNTACSFVRSKEGTTSIEFAALAAPFFTLMLAIFETTMVYFAGATLENAVNDAARTIRTGQAQVNQLSAADFRLMICDRVAPLLKCDDSLHVDVRAFTQFDQVDFPPALNGDGNIDPDTQFNPGAAGDVVLVRVFYSWPVITPVIGQTLSNMSGNNRLVTAATAFRNEPFQNLLP